MSYLAKDTKRGSLQGIALIDHCRPANGFEYDEKGFRLLLLLTCAVPDFRRKPFIRGWAWNFYSNKTLTGKFRVVNKTLTGELPRPVSLGVDPQAFKQIPLPGKEVAKGGDHQRFTKAAGAGGRSNGPPPACDESRGFCSHANTPHGE